MVNMRALFLLTDQHPERLRERAEAEGLDPVVVEGTATLLIANDGNLMSLSPQQRICFDRVILPLLQA